jgi:tetratricopeptide (TPR) repeat protein
MKRKSLRRQKEDIDAHNAEGWAIRFSDTKRALEIGEWCEKRSQKIKHRSGRIFSLYLQSVCQNIFSNYPAALRLLERAQSLVSEETSIQQRAEILNGLGVVYQKIGQYDKSLSALFEAQSLLSASAQTRLKVVIKSNIANIYSDIGEHRVALRYLNEGLSLLEELNDLQLKAIVLHNIMCIEAKSSFKKLASFTLKVLPLQEKRETPPIRLTHCETWRKSIESAANMTNRNAPSMSV